MEVSSTDTTVLVLPLEDSSHVGEVRRASLGLSAQLGFNETDQGRVALVVTEAATNTLVHGGGGTLLLRTMTGPGLKGVEAIFQDRGVGIVELERALRDGHSTAGTPGTGLGAIARQADVFDLYSLPGRGTVLLAGFWVRQPDHGSHAAQASGAHEPPLPLETGTVCVPHPGESVCGDAWATARQGHRDLLMVADGLGHGVLAAAASREAVRVFRDASALSPDQILLEIHAALRSTRGAAVAVAELDHRERRIQYAGVGNIAGHVVTHSENRSMVSHNGTVGHELHKVQQFTYPWPQGALVLMHSDGLQSHWQLQRYPGLAVRHPSLIAGILYRDFARGRDDVAVLVAREQE